MATVKAVHSLKAGGTVFSSGDLVEISDEAEAARLVERGAARWPDAGSEGEAPAEPQPEPEAAPKKSGKGKK